MERRFEARGGRLVGRPDRFDGHTITEYKSTLPDPSSPYAEEIADGFRRQVRIYAAILAEVTGERPVAGRVVAASGQHIDVPLDAGACTAEADAAIAGLDDLNRRLGSGVLPATLARPGFQVCRDCPFKALCSTFWLWLRTGVPEGPSRAAAEGIVESIELGNDDDLYTGHIVIDGATHVISERQPLVLRKSAHGDLRASQPGARWRVVSAKLRQDRRLIADIKTAVYLVSEIPELASAAAA